MAISFTDAGQNSNTSGATVVLTTVVTIPAAVLVIVGTGDSSNAASGGSCTDSGSNTYTSIVAKACNGIASNGFAQFFYFNGNATTLTTITYTKQTSGSNGSIIAGYATGVAGGSAALDTAVTNSATGSSSTPTVTSGTPAVANEIFFGLECWKASATISNDDSAGWTGWNATGAVTNRILGDTQINTGTGTKVYNPTLSAGSTWAIFVVGFKAAPPILLSRNAIIAAILGAWFAVDPQPTLISNIAAVIAPNNPPFATAARNAGFANQQAAIQAQPPDWPYVFNRGWQPYGNGNQANLANVIRNDPQFVHRQRTSTIVSETVALSQPPDWPYVFNRGWQPYANGNLSALSTSIRNTPVPNADVAVATFSAILQWQLPNPLPTLNQKRKPDSVDNPAPNEDTLTNLLVIAQQWQPDIWPPVYMRGGRQPYAQGPLAALSTSIVNNPVPNSDALTNLMAQLVTAWQPPDPLPQVLPRLVFIRADNPPFGYKPFGWSWGDPNVTPIFVGALVPAVGQVPFAPSWFSSVLAWQPLDQMPVLPRKLAPGIPGVSVDQPPRTRVTVVIPDIDFTLPQQQRYLVPVRAFVQPHSPAQIDTVLQWQPPDFILQTRALLAALPGMSVDNPPSLQRLFLPSEEPGLIIQPRSQLAAIIPAAAFVPSQAPWLLTVIRSWDQADPLPVGLQNLAALSTSTVNVPPAPNPNTLVNIGSVVLAWQPPDPLPTLPRNLASLSTSVTNNPPFIIQGRFSNILTAWELGPPLPQLNLFVVQPGATPVVSSIVHNLPFFVTVGKLKSF